VIFDQQKNLTTVFTPEILEELNGVATFEIKKPSF
jgi:hypothetical protein